MAETQMPSNEARAQRERLVPDAPRAEGHAVTGSQQAQPAQQTGPEDVPERPELAPSVELSGQMQEGGFSESQWLIQRDGRFIQVTELLYRLAESIDGKRTLDGIATAVSETYGKAVSADNVRQLIAKQLIPKGLVVKADGSVAGPPEDAGGARSPLAVNMRMAMISPRFIRPATAVLKYLFHPAILIPVLAVAAAAHGWLFFVHGLAQSTRAAMYTPGLMLALMGVIIVSAAFHEFGHAAALEYGGGKVRGMGAGLYIIYPAFYTDVTDNYRLGRWARIRTDLGGFYFNLIFALGVMGMYLLTGQEWLLLAVLFLDMDIVRQMLPIVRLDGYWALADLTGIPDFFSQIPAFLRTVLPLPWWKGPKLPNLKRWVKVVFALYILITIPLLVFLLFLLVKSTPRVLATAWDSFWKQSTTFGQARASGDFLLMAATSMQMLLLALPAFGTLYVIYTLGRRILVGVWNWSKPTPLRRVVGGLGTAGAVALLAFMWLPSLPFSNRASSPVAAAARPQFRPIEPEERGTIGDAVRPVALLTISPDRSPAALDTATPEPATSTPVERTATTDSLTPTRNPNALATSAATPAANGTPVATRTTVAAASPTLAATSTPERASQEAATATRVVAPTATARPAATATARPAATATVAQPAATATARPAATATARPPATATPASAAATLTATPAPPQAANEPIVTATTQAQRAAAPASESTATLAIPETPTLTPAP